MCVSIEWIHLVHCRNHWWESWQQGFNFTQNAEDLLTKWVGVCVWRRTLPLEVLCRLITLETFTADVSVSVIEMSWLRRWIASLSQMRPISTPGHSVCDLWCRKWHWDRFLSWYSSFISSVAFYLCAKLIFHSHSSCSVFIIAFLMWFDTWSRRPRSLRRGLWPLALGHGCISLVTRVRKRKATISFVMSVSLSVHVEQLDSH